MARTVVTGAAGFVGSHLAEALLTAGHEVIGVDAFTDYYDRHEKESNVASIRGHNSFRLIEGDLTAINLEDLLDGVDYVFHLAGQAGVRPSWGASFQAYIQHNISATQRLLEASKNARLRKLVFASSSSVYGNAEQLPASERALPAPVSPYGVTKLAAEQLCSLYGQLFGLPVVSLRLFTVYGPRQRPDMAIRRFLAAALQDKPITIYGDGEQTRDFTFVQDVVTAHLQAMHAPADPCVYNICGGSRISIRKLLEMIQATTGRELSVDYADAAHGDARHTFGDGSLAQRTFGFRPKVSLAEGIEAQWRWLIARTRGEK